MDKKEFSELLVKLRTSKNCSRYALGMGMNVSQVVLQRIERADNNYGMNKVFDYLKQFNACIFVTNGSISQIICSEEYLIKWIISQINTIGRSKFAELSGIHRSTFLNIETGKTTARIDTFLKIIEALGYRIDKIC